MAGTDGAFHALGHRARLNPGVKAGGIDFLGRRRKDRIGARARQPFQILLKGARVAGEILARPELRRIDKDGRRHRGVVGPRPPRQRQMPPVQRPHRRRQPQRTPRPPAKRRHFGAGDNDFHTHI